MTTATTTTPNNIIHTNQLPPADYEIRSYPTDDYLYTHQSSPPRPTIIDFRHYSDEYNDENNIHYRDNINDVEDVDEDLENFQFHSLRRPEVIRSYVQRTDTSTESFPGNYSTTIVPKSILKGSISTTPPPLPPPIDPYPISYPQTQHSRTSSKYDESPRISVKINTDESIPIDYPTSAIEKIIPNESIISSNVPTSISSSSNRMRFASVSQLNEIEWEVPSEFQTVIYDLTDGKQSYRRGAVNNNLNNNNNNNNDKSSIRQRSQSAVVDQRTHVSRLFVPWDPEKKILQPFYLSDGLGQNDTTQQQAFEY